MLQKAARGGEEAMNAGIFFFFSFFVYPEATRFRSCPCFIEGFLEPREVDDGSPS